MDLYFHTLPKKRMLLSSFKKKRIGIIESEQQQQDKLVNVSKPATVTGYFQNKLSFIHAKKIWNQMIPYTNRQKTMNNSAKSSSTVLFDSNEHLKTISTPPTPPPKKSITMPNLVAVTSNNNEQLIVHRDLPSLPSVDSYTFTTGDKKTGLTRATTWVGNSIQKWLSSTEAEEKRKMAILMDHSELDEEEEQSILYSGTLLSINPLQRMILHCRILQVTNLASSKNYQYTMNMRVTNNVTQTHAGIMKRVAKGISAAYPRVALLFHVQGNFQLECDIVMKQCSSTKFVDRIKSLRSRNNISSIITEEEDEDDDYEKNNVTNIRGRLVLDSGDEPLSSFANKGIGQYTIQTSTQVEAALELTVAFWLEENSEDLKDNENLCKPIDQEVLKYCEAGDYLTFYVKGESYPLWIRYWVSYKNNQLILRLNERGEEPVDIITLKSLSSVNINPSDDIQEEIYLGKKYGIILTFGKYCIYLFGDNSKSTLYWKSLLEQHQSFTIAKATNTTTIATKKKYLWPSSVAQ